MKWSIFVCLVVCSASYCDGLALKCPPGVTDPSCTEERKEVDTHEAIKSGATEVQCLAGSEWESNCHYCRCSNEGVAECFKQDTCDKGMFAEPVLCKPNTTFQRDCNTCICLDNGLGLCTLEYCRRSDSLGGPPEIQIATDSGSEVIVSKDESTQKSGNTDVVVPGADHVERHSVCRSRNTFYIGCNTCRCNAYGTDYTCTNKVCPLPADVELFHELKTTKSTVTSSKNHTKSQVCVANRMFIKDCNTCWCNEDGTSYYCTRRVCVPLLPEDEADIGGIPAENLRVIKRECRPNEVFELDCNMCRCNPDGKSYSCTRRACEEQLEDEKKVTLSRKVRAFTTEPPKTCQPGQEFRMDCNKCLCDNKGQDFSCTRIDCNTLNNNHHASKRDTSEQVSMQCVPGSVFNRDCNVCRCTEDGKFAICTIKMCKENKSETEHAPESDLGFRCNPGEQFKRDCNDCTCSADGKSVFCTLRLCDI